MTTQNTMMAYRSGNAYLRSDAVYGLAVGRAVDCAVPTLSRGTVVVCGVLYVSRAPDAVCICGEIYRSWIPEGRVETVDVSTVFGPKGTVTWMHKHVPYEAEYTEMRSGVLTRHARAGDVYCMVG